MTVQEEVRQRIEQDHELIRLRKKIESGKATYADTAAYSNRAGKLLGEVFSRRLPEIPLEEREPLCVELLHDRYIDINAAVDTAQRFMDEALGIHIAPQHAPFDSERGHQIGSSLRDLSKPVETLQRRSRAATETATKAIHDDRMKAESKFRHRAGLDCHITRVAVNGCCPWCSKVAGRYRYGEEPDDIYRRHDNCDCTVTFENGRKRQDVWSKREWETPEPGAGAGDAVVLTEEQAAAAGAGERVVLTKEQAREIEAKNGLTYGRKPAIMKNIELPPETDQIRSMSAETKQLVSDAFDKIMGMYEVHLDQLITEPIFKEDGKTIEKTVPFQFQPRRGKDGELVKCIVINSMYDFMGNQEEMQARIMRNFTSGVLASNSIEGLIAHELAHVMTFQDIYTYSGYLIENKSIAKRFVSGISIYADRKDDGSECIAEAFAAKICGQPISQEAQKLLDEFIERRRKHG